MQINSILEPLDMLFLRFRRIDIIKESPDILEGFLCSVFLGYPGGRNIRKEVLGILIDNELLAKGSVDLRIIDQE